MVTAVSLVPTRTRGACSHRCADLRPGAGPAGVAEAAVGWAPVRAELAHEAESALLVTLHLRSSICLAGRPPDTHRYLHLLADRDPRENVLIGHTAKLSRHTVRQEEPLFVFFCMGDPQQSLSEETCELTSL